MERTIKSGFMFVGKKGTCAGKSQCLLKIILLQQKQEAPFDLMRPLIKNPSSYLGTAGEKRFDVDVGVVNFEVMVSQPSGHADGGQHPCL